jgi:hypothetical protein
LAAEKDPDVPDLVPGEVVDVRGGQIVDEVQAAGSPAHGGAHEGQDAVRAGRLDGLDRELEVGTPVLKVGEDAPDAIWAFVVTPDGSPWRPQPDVLRTAS